MAGVILDTELLVDHATDHRGRPHPREKPIGDGPTVHEIRQGGPLPGRQRRRPPRAMPLEEALQAVVGVVLQPQSDRRPGRLQHGGDLGAGASLHVQHDRVDPPGDSVLALPLGVALEPDKSLDRPPMPAEQPRSHAILLSHEDSKLKIIMSI